MREDRIQALVQQMSQQRQVPTIRQDRVQALVNQMQKPQQNSGFTPQESQHYQQTLSQSEGRKIQPFEEKRIASEMRKKYPELKNLTNQKVIDIYHEQQRHRLRGFGESAAKGALSALDLPQAIASLATLGKYKPEYLSQDVQRLLKDKAGIDLNKEQALSPSEKRVFKGTEWGGSALSGSGIGKGLVKGLAPAAKATEAVPYVGKAISGTQKTAGALYGAPSSGKELVKQTAVATGLGTAAGELENQGLSAEQASLIGLAPAASGIARGLIKAPYGKAVKSLNPGQGDIEAAQKLSQIDEAALAKDALMEQVQPMSERVTSFKPAGQAVRGKLESTIEELRNTPERIAVKNEYDAAKQMTDLLRPSEGIKAVREAAKNLRKGSPEKNKLSKILKVLKETQEGSDTIKVGPEGTARVQKNKGMPINQINDYITELSNEAAKASTKGDSNRSRYLNKIIAGLNKDLDANPHFASRRAAYREAMAPINRIEDTFGKLLEKTDYNAGNVIGDSNIPKKVVKISLDDESFMDELLNVVKDDEHVIKQLKDYVNTQMIKKITKDGHVQLDALHKFTENNPGIYRIDPSLKTKLKNVSNAQAHYNKLVKSLKTESEKDLDILKTIGGKALVGAGIGNLANLPGAAILGTAAGIGSGLQLLKKGRYKKAIQRGLEERGH